MAQIGDLWELQKHTNILKNISKTLKDIAYSDKVKALVLKLEETEKKLSGLKIKIEEKENQLSKRNFILNEHDGKLQEIEKDLYGGNISDLKQLTMLDQERNNLKNKIEKKESEILYLLEDIEEIKKDFFLIKKSFEELRKEYIKLIQEHKSLRKELKTKAIAEQKKIAEISSIIDEELLKKYNRLTKNRGVAIAEVIDNRCSGCNMVLPSITIDRLKNDNLILFCENCDRILYFKK